jgi:hypothetical protein
MTLPEAVATFGPVGGVLMFLAWAYAQRQPPGNPLGEVMRRLEDIETKIDRMENHTTDRLARVETNIENLNRRR